jgi:hypothetical protein
LDSRPTDEHPLRSLLVVLNEMAPRILEDSEELRWGFRVAEEQHVVPAHEQSPMKQRFGEAVAAFIAERLGTSAESDPRPTAWATVVSSLFGATMRCCADPEAGMELDVAFISLVRETATALLEGCEAL